MFTSSNKLIWRLIQNLGNYIFKYIYILFWDIITKAPAKSLSSKYKNHKGSTKGMHVDNTIFYIEIQK